MNSIKLIDAATATGAGSAISPNVKDWAFQAYGSTSAGTGAATVTVEGSLDGTHWLTLGTISLTLGVTETTDGFSISASWKALRGNVTAISGTNAAVTLLAAAA